MVKLSLLVAVGAIGAALAFPFAENDQANESERELQLRQGGILAAILGQIGTSLVPVVGAVLGPILTNLATGISQAFNSGLNSESVVADVVDLSYLSYYGDKIDPAATATPTNQEESAGSDHGSDHGSDGSGLLVRIPPDSPLYHFILSATVDNKEGLPSVGPSPAASAQKPLAFGGKFVANFHPDTSDPAPVHVGDSSDSVAVNSDDDANEKEAKYVNPNVKRYPHTQRVRTETEYA